MVKTRYVLFAVVLVLSTFLYFRHIFSIKKGYFANSNILKNVNVITNKGNTTTIKINGKTKIELMDPFCKTKVIFNSSQLILFLNRYYNNTNLNYGQYKGLYNSNKKSPLKTLPECYFKNIFIGLNQPITHFISLEDFRENLIKEFENKHSVKVTEKYLCENKRCILKPYPKTVKRPKPEKFVKNTKKVLDEQAVLAELKRLRNDGLQKGDDDLENLKFLNEYLSSEKNVGFKVPNLIHYIWFSCHTFKMSTYLCMLSALKNQNPDFILIHGDCEPEGKYWELFKSAAGEKLKLVKKSPVTQIFGKKISVVEHQADVARLQVVLQVGGIYLDDDVVVLKSLDELRRDNDIVLGEASPISLANGGIIANKNSWFLKRWFQQYQTFNDALWGANSVQTALALWQLFPEEIKVVPVTMMRPNWMEYNMLHHGLMDWSEHYTMHLSTRYMDEFDKSRTLAQFAVLQTTYGEIARFVLWGSSDKLDVRPWILHPDFNKV